MKHAPAKSCPSCGERYDADVLFCPRDGTPIASSRRSPTFSSAERDPYVGMELTGQIRIQHLIGIGSMGRVYRAFQGGIDRDVAVKILHRELSGNAELVSRFHREAKVASRLVHPNVVQVLMTGSVPFSSDPRIGGELYLVMEHLDGISLLSALAAAGTGEEGRALPLPRVLHIILQICDAVGEAHAQGIVHRDLKPENVMLVRRGEDADSVKVLDFGIARLSWADKSMATQAGLIFGTAKYISPEGAEGQPVGPPADVYSIATMLYECLAGRAPFEGDSPVALLVQHTHAPPAELRSVARASYVPAPLAQVVMQSLSKKPGERPRDARALGRELVLATRSSGLDPDEIAQASPGRGGAVVKLASKARTRALELSPELAARIGGVPAPTPTLESAQPAITGGLDAGGEEPPAPSRDGAGGPARAESWAGGPRPDAPAPSAREGAGDAPHERASWAGAARASGPSSPGSGPIAGPSSRRQPQLDFNADPTHPGASDPGRQSDGFVVPGALADAALDPAFHDMDTTFAGVGAGRGSALAGAADAGRGSALAGAADAGRGSALADPSTMQGVASETPPRPRRARIARATAILACAAAAVLVVVLGGRHLGSFGAAESDGSLEAQLDRARDCMRRRAWDEPPGENVKEIVGRALSRWPSDPRVAEIRREASERIITDALGRKYAGDAASATRLAKLALELQPALTTAQHLVAELEGGRDPAAPSVAPATAVVTTASRGPVPPPRGAGAEPPPPAPPTAPPTAAPPKTAAPQPTAASTSAPAPALPPSPPPLPTDQAPPASTGPWL